jgi:transketolase
MTAARSPNPREAYGQALAELGGRVPSVVALEADLGKSTRSVVFGEAFPERYFEMGIAEQNMISVAAGMALSGKVPFVHSFAVFASGRAYDQLRCSVCIPNLKVRVCGSSAGLSDFGDGKTHQSVEDMALMRALPNMTVLCPADAEETARMVAALGDLEGPAYLRVSRNDLPAVFPRSEEYRIGKVFRLREGRDLVVFACGVMVSRALEAAEALEAEGISARVVNVSTLKPLDRAAVIAESAGMRAIVTAEEHSVIGGLGSCVVEALRAERRGPVEFVGLQDRFGLSARDYGELLAHMGLDAAGVARAARAAIAASASPEAGTWI